MKKFDERECVNKIMQLIDENWDTEDHGHFSCILMGAASRILEASVGLDDAILILKQVVSFLETKKSGENL